MNKSYVQRFETIKDILIYIATATHAVGSAELQDNVTDLCRSQTNNCLKGLVREGYLISNGLQSGRAYTATDKTRELFGIANKTEGTNHEQ